MPTLLHQSWLLSDNTQLNFMHVLRASSLERAHTQTLYHPIVHNNYRIHVAS